MATLHMKRPMGSPKKKTNGSSLVMKKYHPPVKTRGSRYTKA